jgi:hypothetical protein
MTYTRENTGKDLSGKGFFDAEPDQIIFGRKNKNIYFTEDGGSSPGVFVRDVESGGYRCMFQAIPGGKFEGDETVGLAMSPDGSRFYAAMQDAGILYEITRTDGQAFE